MLLYDASLQFHLEQYNVCGLCISAMIHATSKNIPTFNMRCREQHDSPKPPAFVTCSDDTCCALPTATEKSNRRPWTRTNTYNHSEEVIRLANMQHAHRYSSSRNPPFSLERTDVHFLTIAVMLPYSVMGGKVSSNLFLILTQADVRLFTGCSSSRSCIR